MKKPIISDPGDEIEPITKPKTSERQTLETACRLLGITNTIQRYDPDTGLTYVMGVISPDYGKRLELYPSFLELFQALPEQIKPNALNYLALYYQKGDNPIFILASFVLYARNKGLL